MPKPKPKRPRSKHDLADRLREAIEALGQRLGTPEQPAILTLPVNGLSAPVNDFQ